MPVIGLALIAAITLAMLLAGCASWTVVGIDEESVKGPSQVRQFGTIDPKDITVYALYQDESRKQYSLSRNEITFDSSKVGRQTVNVRVQGAFTASFETEVMELTGITVSAQPPAIKVGVGINDSWPGLEIQGVWDQMSSDKINNAECQITGLNVFREGSQTITVAWNGKQTTFDVNVVDMASLRITTNPTKTTYYQGEPLVLTGIRAVGVWQGLPEETISISLSDVTGYNPQTVGRQTLTASKNGRTATFTVEVLDIRSILNGTWAADVDGWLEVGQEFTFNNGSYIFKYSNGGTPAQVNGTYTVTNTNGTLNAAFTPELPRFRWRSFTVETNPMLPSGRRVTGTVLHVLTSLDTDTSTYRLIYIKR